MDQGNPELHFSVFKAGLEFTVAIGSNILVYHAGRFIPEEAFPIYTGRSISKKLAHRLMKVEREQIALLAEEYPTVTICIENVRPYLYSSPYCYGEQIELIQEQIEKVGKPNVSMNLDLGHLYMAAHYYRFDPAEAIQKIASLISHTYVHDNFGGCHLSTRKNLDPSNPFWPRGLPYACGVGERPDRRDFICLSTLLSRDVDHGIEKPLFSRAQRVPGESGPMVEIYCYPTGLLIKRI